jgi:hypothetical protein
VTSTHSSWPAAGERWFYSAASTALLVFTFLGFQMFYLEGRAYPGRELTPPIRTLLLIHGLSMSAWMLLAVVQPLLVACGRKRLHRTFGRVGAALAVLIVVSGCVVSVRAAQVNPPDLRLFGLVQNEFLYIPLSNVLLFGGFVFLGVLHRRRAVAHRPLMFMASLAVVPAALARITPLNSWYAGTALEYWLSAYVIALILGVILLAARCWVAKAIDRWYVGAFGVLALVWVTTSIIARSSAWKAMADWLIST